MLDTLHRNSVGALQWHPIADDIIVKAVEPLGDVASLSSTEGPQFSFEPFTLSSHMLMLDEWQSKVLAQDRWNALLENGACTTEKTCEPELGLKLGEQALGEMEPVI